MKKIILKGKKKQRDSLIYFSSIGGEKILKFLNGSSRALLNDDVEKKKIIYGENQIKKTSFPYIKTFFKVILNPFVIILSLIATYYLFNYFYFDSRASNKNNKTDLFAAIIIISMITISCMVNYFQELSAFRASSILKKMVRTTCSVFRPSAEEEASINLGENKKLIDEIFSKCKEVEIKDLVPGDIIYFSAGDMIPADVRLLETNNFFINQSSLTGESEAIEKFPHIESRIIEQNYLVKNIFEIKNLCFMGSSVVSGSAVAVVCATGKNTYFGSFSLSLTKQKLQTNFEKGIKKITWILISLMIFAAPTVFFIYVGTKEDSSYLKALVFVIAVIVGLTPELLPMIITANLARGSLKIAQKQVIVKNLIAVNNLGSVNILCTDKTGTLTEDKIALVRHINFDNKVSEETLKYAYLNSFYQTGIKSMIDKTIIQHVNSDHSFFQKRDYKKVDEIPFDFEKRKLSVVLEEDKKNILICKGAVEELINSSKNYLSGNKLISLTAREKNKILSLNKSLNQQGLRVIAVARKYFPAEKKIFTKNDETNLTLVGYIAFLDVIKKSANNTIKFLEKYGIKVKILTGDNEIVTRAICKRINFKIKNLINGEIMDDISDKELYHKSLRTNVFVKTSPLQKSRIVRVLKKFNSKNTVAFLGDGINDALALKHADVGISVATANDIAKESSDIILLKKSLEVLTAGVLEGRRTFTNILKYLKIAIASNVGNIISIIFASGVIPFEPMTPTQLLFQNILFDFTQLSLPWDNVDREALYKPCRWRSNKEFLSFVSVNAILSSYFDIVLFLILLNITHDTPEKQKLFQTTWFIFGTLTQISIVYMLRSEKIIFLQNTRVVFSLLFFSFLVIILTFSLPWTDYGRISLSITNENLKKTLPIVFFLTFMYCFCSQVMKKVYLTFFKEWI